MFNPNKIINTPNINLNEY
jgi:hypothetical protein